MATVKIGSGNRVVLPKEAREHLGVGPGDELLVVPRGNKVIVLGNPRRALDELAGSGKGVYGRPARYLRREQNSWTRGEVSRS